jgi:hypothetical protein
VEGLHGKRTIIAGGAAQEPLAHPPCAPPSRAFAPPGLRQHPGDKQNNDIGGGAPGRGRRGSHGPPSALSSKLSSTLWASHAGGFTVNPQKDTRRSCGSIRAAAASPILSADERFSTPMAQA